MQGHDEDKAKNPGQGDTGSSNDPTYQGDQDKPLTSGGMAGTTATGDGGMGTSTDTMSGDTGSPGGTDAGTGGTGMEERSSGGTGGMTGTTDTTGTYEDETEG